MGSERFRAPAACGLRPIAAAGARVPGRACPAPGPRWAAPPSGAGALAGRVSPGALVAGGGIGAAPLERRMRVRLSVLPGLRRGRHGPPGLVVTFAFLSRTDVTAPGTVRPAEEVQSALFRLRCTKAQWPWAAGRRGQAGPRTAEDCAPASAVGFLSERRETAATTCTHAPLLVQACADWVPVILLGLRMRRDFGGGRSLRGEAGEHVSWEA
ncbi:uncharacterized protein [Vulpes vulpes]|uniref:Uncharacterized protein n=1 Tax=Vulpes vulpes TaxID=9627 RepID=A0ABM4XKL6_VULVU